MNIYFGISDIPEMVFYAFVGWTWFRWARSDKKIRLGMEIVRGASGLWRRDCIERPLGVHLGACTRERCLSHSFLVLVLGRLRTFGKYCPRIPVDYNGLTSWVTAGISTASK